jgi:hypothetical protein
MIIKFSYKVLTVLAFIILSQPAIFAQGGDQDFLRSTGKIYGVIAAVVLILLGIAYYLWRLDNKLTKLEKQFGDGK